MFLVLALGCIPLVRPSPSFPGRGRELKIWPLRLFWEMRLGDEGLAFNNTPLLTMIIKSLITAFVTAVRGRQLAQAPCSSGASVLQRLGKRCINQ